MAKSIIYQQEEMKNKLALQLKDLDDNLRKLANRTEEVALENEELVKQKATLERSLRLKQKVVGNLTSLIKRLPRNSSIRRPLLVTKGLTEVEKVQIFSLSRAGLVRLRKADSVRLRTFKMNGTPKLSFRDGGGGIEGHSPQSRD
jgi:hypothetical protein